MGHEFVDTRHLVDDGEDFAAGEDGGEAFGAFGRGGEKDRVKFFLEDFAIEKEDGRESLVLGGGRDVLFDGEVGEEGLDFWGAHFERVAFVVEEYEAAHPVEVGLFRAVGVVFGAQDVACLVEEFFGHGT